MTRDWLRWHEDYDTAGSSLARRLAVVRRYLGRALTEAPAEPDGRRRLISLCAGDGRDVLPVLARHDAGRGVRAVLAELDPSMAIRAELLEHGFAEIAFEEPADARFRVGMHRLVADPVPARRLSRERLFAFA